MDLSIIIVNYRSRAKLLSCLESIRQSADEGLSKEIIIVDNNSGDDLSGIIFKDKNESLILSKKNLGMGGGNNLGLERARGEFALILNPDTVLRPGAIKIMVDYLRQEPTVGLVGPKLLNPDGSLQLSCRRWPSIFLPILRRTSLGRRFRVFQRAVDKFLMTDFDHNHIRPVDWLLGSCLLIRRELVLSDGSMWRPRFDHRYFMYFEDTDLARQLWSRGWSVVYHPQALVVHDHQRQSARYPWYMAVVLDPLARAHLSSWLKYFIKWSIKSQRYAKN